MNNYADILKEKKLKITPQRLAIYEILHNSKSHPSVENIYRQLGPLYSTMSLATVYKTVEAFKNAGLVQAINVGEDRFRYDADTGSHPHFYCSHCKEVYDFPVEELHNIKDKLQDTAGFKIKEEQLFFYGMCPECAAKENMVTV